MPSSTPKISLRKPVDADLISRLTDINANMDAVDLNNAARVCTSSTRPSGAFVGQLIYETNTDMVMIWDGAAWKVVEDSGQAGWILLERGSKTAQLTNTYDITQGGLFAAADFDMIRFSARGQANTAIETVGIRLNADSGTNYQYGRVSFRNDTGAATESTFGAAQTRFANQRWNINQLNNFSVTIYQQPSQDRSAFGYGFFMGASSEVTLFSGRWNSTAAISSITILSTGGVNTLDYLYSLEGHLA